MAFWRRHFLGAELMVAVAATITFGAWTRYGHGTRFLEKLIGGQRGVVYGTLATLDGALLGFVIATTAIVLGFAPSDRFAILRDSAHYQTLWRTFTSTIRALALATGVAIAALLVDRDERTNMLVMVLCAGTTLLSALRLWRSVWVLEGAIKVVTRSDS